MYGFGRVGGIIGSALSGLLMQAGFATATILQMLTIPFSVTVVALLVKGWVGHRTTWQRHTVEATEVGSDVQ
ncbi:MULTISPECIES: hypothetical protein [unclassified Pseudomonas]|uniref:hypothetical protein n=1 Tax=unclassified Pseudomonas TaxID=196821 RepID=UPI0039B77EDC